MGEKWQKEHWKRTEKKMVRFRHSDTGEWREKYYIRVVKVVKL